MHACAPRRARRPLVLVVLALLAGSPARGEDAPAPSTVRLDTATFRGASVPKSSRGLWLPSDAGLADAWYGHYEEEAPGDSFVLRAFGEPWNPDFAMPPEVIDDLLRRIVGAEAGEAWSTRTDGDALEIQASPAATSRAAAAFAFVREGFAPRLSVTAELLDADPPGTVRDLGAAAVLPRRWTPLLRRRDVAKFHVGYELEVAQEALLHAPLIAALPEGWEVYARWTPGEGVSILEVLALVQAHGDAFEADLSPLRASPEVNAPGRVRLPRTSAWRARTALLLPTGSPTEAVFDWRGPSGGGRLRLRIGAPPAGPADLASGPNHWGIVRAGAAFAPLEDAARPGGVETAIRAFRNAGVGEIDLEPQAQAFLLASGPRDLVTRLRETVARAESSLSGGQLEFFTAVLPEAPRAEGTAGLEIGRVLPPALLAAVGPASEATRVRVPYVDDLETSVRSGASVTGLAYVDASIAQASAGLMPLPGAWFDGLAVQARVHRIAGGGRQLVVRGSLGWARPDGAEVLVSQRLPIPLDLLAVPPMGPDLQPTRTFPIPLATFGEAKLDVEAAFGEPDLAERRPVLLAFLRGWPRGDGGREGVVLLLARLL